MLAAVVLVLGSMSVAKNDGWEVVVEKAILIMFLALGMFRKVLKVDY